MAKTNSDVIPILPRQARCSRMIGGVGGLFYGKDEFQRDPDPTPATLQSTCTRALDERDWGRITQKIKHIEKRSHRKFREGGCGRLLITGIVRMKIGKARCSKCARKKQQKNRETQEAGRQWVVRVGHGADAQAHFCRIRLGLAYQPANLKICFNKALARTVVGAGRPH